MVRPGLDDTLHAVVHLTHEHGLPLHGVNVHGGYVQVFTDAVHVPWWVRWLTDVDGSRFTVWTHRGDVAFNAKAHRDGIEWTLADSIPAATAGPILAAHGEGVSTEHHPIPANVAIALADAYAGYDQAAAEGGAA